MTTLLKILLCVVLGFVALKLCALLILPAAFGVGALLALGTGLLGVLAAVTVGLLALALFVLVVLAPVWLPVLAVCGLVSLCRRRPAAKVG